MDKGRRAPLVGLLVFCFCGSNGQVAAFTWRKCTKAEGYVEQLADVTLTPETLLHDPLVYEYMSRELCGSHLARCTSDARARA